MRSPPPAPIQIVSALAPVLLSLIFVGVGSVEIRERYRVVADVLVYVLAVALVVTIFHLIYPYTLQAPAVFLSRRLATAYRNGRDKRGFMKWCENWRAYSDFVVDQLAHPNQDRWRAGQKEYAERRSWLIGNQYLLPADAATYMGNHLVRQWGPLNLTEYEHKFTIAQGFFPLYRHPSCERQLSEMSDPRHHMTHTLVSVWDGLTSYGVSRKWAPLGRIREPHHTTSRRFLSGLPPV
jgi:hypothetical protein